MQSPADLVRAAQFVSQLARTVQMLQMPHIGEYKWSCRGADYEGWLLCDGRSVSRAEYSSLFALVGTSFGAASGSTFRLPDFRGRVPGAAGAGPGLTARGLGEAAGVESKALGAAELPSHSHTGTTGAGGAHSHGVTDPGHAHTLRSVNDDLNLTGGAYAPGSDPSFPPSDTAGAMTWNNINASTTGVTVNAAADHTHAFTTASAGGGAAFSLLQPTLFGGNVFVYAGVGASAPV